MECEVTIRYNQSWGWDSDAKTEELREETAKYIVAFDQETGNPLAFVHFRFDTEEGSKGDREIVYW